MSLVQAIIIGVFYYLSNSYCFSYRYLAARPIVLGLLVGLVLGDPVKGALYGAMIQLPYIGVAFVGGSVPSDTGMAAVVGVSAGLIGGLSIEEAVAISIPIGLIGNIIHYTRMVYFSFFVRLTDKFVADGKEDYIWLTNVLLPQLTLFILCVIPATLAVYYGVDAIVSLVTLLSGKFYSIISVMAGMLPAIGIAITLSLIFKGEAIPFFFLGFLFVSVFGLGMVPASFLSILLAIIYIKLKKSGRANEGGKA